MERTLSLHQKLFRAAVVVAVLGLTACSSEPAKTSEVKTDTEAAKKPAGPPGACHRKDGVL